MSKRLPARLPNRLGRLAKDANAAGHRLTVAVDFDGTLVEHRTDRALSLAQLRPGAREALEQFRAANFQIVIWTARTDLPDVEAWLQAQNVPYDAINANPAFETGSRKIMADVYLDDHNILVQDRPWEEIARDVMLTLQGKARQPIGEEEGYAELRALAEQALPELNQLLAALNCRTIRFEDLGLGDLEVQLQQPGPVIIVGPIKTEARATEKVEADYGGDWRKLLDVVRASVALDSLPEAYQAVEKIRDTGAVYARYPKDRFREPLANGYRDYLCNYRLPCGLIVEVQFHVKPILVARERARLAYDVVRAIKASMEEEGREEMTAGEAEACRRARAASHGLFARAWEEAQLKERGINAMKGLPSRLKGSYFSDCPRDRQGRCKPRGGGGDSGNKPSGQSGSPPAPSAPGKPARSKPPSRLPASAKPSSREPANPLAQDVQANIRAVKEQVRQAKQAVRDSLSGLEGRVRALQAVPGALLAKARETAQGWLQKATEYPKQLLQHAEDTIDAYDAVFRQEFGDNALSSTVGVGFAGLALASQAARKVLGPLFAAVATRFLDHARNRSGSHASVGQRTGTRRRSKDAEREQAADVQLAQRYWQGLCDAYLEKYPVPEGDAREDAKGIAKGTTLMDVAPAYALSPLIGRLDGAAKCPCRSMGVPGAAPLPKRLALEEKGPVLDSVRSAGAWLAKRWADLEDRYGRAGALSMAVAALATMPLPGSVPAIIAVAEGIRGMRGTKTEGSAESAGLQRLPTGEQQRGVRLRSALA